MKLIFDLGNSPLNSELNFSLFTIQALTPLLWQWWEMIPGSLYTLGEAVRVARNAAAHDTTRKFSKAEVALLLSAMPTQLEMIANLTDFLQNLPSSLSQLRI